MLDERLSLAARLYEPCALGADIGTDHGLLPCELLETNVCQRMLLCDVSPKAIKHAEASVALHHLEDRAKIVCTDGLNAIDEPCGCISIMGMGGDTMAAILREGQNRLHGAVLVLSAHTGQDIVRRVLPEIGYHIVREELCQAAGRYYIFWRAEPGLSAMDENEIRYGRLLYQTGTPLLRPYLEHRIAVWSAKHDSLTRVQDFGNPEYAASVDALAFYRARLEELK